jgi:hypothetical protein
MTAGCGEWPRFANLPATDEVGVAPPRILSRMETLVEPLPGAGWPDLPELLPAEEQATLGALWEVTDLVGTLDPAGQNGDAKAPFACAEHPSTVHYTEASDIDWVHLGSDGGPLCILIETDAPTSSQWDVVVHAYEPGTGCVTGTFLNPEATDAPEFLLPEVGAFLADVPRGPLALYVASVGGVATGTEVAYTVHVVPATVAESCEALQVTDMTDPADTP